MVSPNSQQLNAQKLQQILLSLLGESQLNLLGKYQLINGTTIVATVPAIRVNYPQQLETITRKVIPNSGIECVINAQPTTYRKYHNFANSTVLTYWEVILDQHHPINGINEALDAIYRLNTLYIPETPIIRPAMPLEGNKGVSKTRAILYVQQAKFLKSYF